MHPLELTRATWKVRSRGTPFRFDPVDESVVISDRLSRSSTKYGPSVSAGVATHAGVATELAVGVVSDAAEGEGEPRAADGLRPVHAATIAPKPTRRAVRRETMDSNRDFTPRQRHGMDCAEPETFLGIRSELGSVAIHQWRDVLAGSGQDFNALLKET